MSGLKFFNKDTYESLGDALKAIKQELLSLCPKDSSSVRWQRGADGVSAVVKTIQSAAEDGDDVPEESAQKSSAYNGYFTLRDVSTYNEDGTIKEYRVVVCDGETWNPETKTSGKSEFKVRQNDNIVFSASLESKEFIITKSTTFAIRYCHGTKEAEIISYTFKPLENTGYFYYVIGEAVIENGSVKIIQRHQTTNEMTIGIAEMTIGYTGDFCVYFIQPEGDGVDTYKAPTEIVVCNGADYNPKTQTSSKSKVSVNNYYNFEIEATKFSNVNTSVYVVYDLQKHLEKLTAEDKNENAKEGGEKEDDEKFVTIQCLDAIESVGKVYESIAQVTPKTITPQHTNKTVRMWGIVNVCE